RRQNSDLGRHPASNAVPAIAIEATAVADCEPDSAVNGIDPYRRQPLTSKRVQVSVILARRRCRKEGRLDSPTLRGIGPSCKKGPADFLTHLEVAHTSGGTAPAHQRAGWRLPRLC